MPQTRDLACSSSMWPNWESNLQPLGLQDNAHPLSHTSQGCVRMYVIFSFIFSMYVFFWEVFFSGYLPIFKSDYLLLWVIWVTYIFWLLTPYQMYGLQIFSPMLRLFFDRLACCTELFSLPRALSHTPEGCGFGQGTQLGCGFDPRSGHIYGRHWLMIFFHMDVSLSFSLFLSL